ncbi:hypothetical protein SBA6_100027 [Candidatus Sulfopaludibacter sp. SbA6]|nr:hypothetical protein SBA6_100027 [Candidatus Sulfopaludibacter sp. SbA6]
MPPRPVSLKGNIPTLLSRKPLSPCRTASTTTSTANNLSICDLAMFFIFFSKGIHNTKSVSVQVHLLLRHTSRSGGLRLTLCITIPKYTPLSSTVDPQISHLF